MWESRPCPLLLPLPPPGSLLCLSLGPSPSLPSCQFFLPLLLSSPFSPYRMLEPRRGSPLSPRPKPRVGSSLVRLVARAQVAAPPSSECRCPPTPGSRWQERWRRPRRQERRLRRLERSPRRRRQEGGDGHTVTSPPLNTHTTHGQHTVVCVAARVRVNVWPASGLHRQAPLGPYL